MDCAGAVFADGVEVAAETGMVSVVVAVICSAGTTGFECTKIGQVSGFHHAANTS